MNASRYEIERGERVWSRWLDDAYLCRYGNVNIFELRRLNRALTPRESLLFRAALQKHMEKEFAPLPGTTPTQ